MTNYKYIPALILAAASLASCSEQDEIIASSGDEIRISAVYENTSRATTAYCPANMPEQFTLQANLASNGNTFIKSTSVVKTASGYTFADGVTRYWPKDDLFVTAYLNDEKTYNNGQFVNYQIKPEVAQQLDLLYAVNPAAKQADGAIRMNFRHALSQVVFKGIVTNRTIKVDVRSISLGGVYDCGTFTLPSEEATTETWLDPKTDHVNPDNGTTNKNYPSAGVGSWEVFTNAATAEYTVEANATLTAKSDNTTTGDWLTAYSSHSGDWQKVMILMPQQTAAWSPEAATEGGAYICIDCDINNVDGTTETLVHSGKMYIPLTVDWQPGFRYVYTIIFGNGGNAYDDKENPDEVFFPVNVDITVDDFLPETSADTQYGTSKNITVTYHGYGDDEAAQTAVSAQQYGAQWVVATPSTYSGTLPEGCEFIGWSTAAGCIEPMCKPGESIKLLEGDEIYPVIVKYFSVTYSFNNGKYVSEKKYVAVPEATTCSIMLPDFHDVLTVNVAAGYDFKGWYFNSDTSTIYAAGTTLELTQLENTLHSRWDKL